MFLANTLDLQLKVAGDYEHATFGAPHSLGSSTQKARSLAKKNSKKLPDYTEKHCRTSCKINLHMSQCCELDNSLVQEFLELSTTIKKKNSIQMPEK